MALHRFHFSSIERRQKESVCDSEREESGEKSGRGLREGIPRDSPRFAPSETQTQTTLVLIFVNQATAGGIGFG